MFYPEKIKSIKKNDYVLEIGPGGNPYRRSDVLLEKRFDDREAEAQRGYALPLKTTKRMVYYNGGIFPFKDKEFDYVICSHVIEHIPQSELSLFFSELHRVASKGYIEFPTIYYEVINYQKQHLWFINYINSEILFLDKKKFQTNFVHQTLRSLFYVDSDLKNIFNLYKELFFVGFEWNQKVAYQIVDTYDDINDENLDYWKIYFKKGKERNRKRKLIAKIKKIRKLFCKKENYISPKAIIEDKELIRLGKGSEIQDYVIIRTFENVVTIGEYAQINPYTVIYGGAGVKIGDNVMIAPHCVLAAGDHNYTQIKRPMRFAGSINSKPIVIENDVWIGANCTITAGVTVARGAVVGANSVVTKDVKAYDIVGGCPARVLKNRKKQF